MFSGFPELFIERSSWCLNREEVGTPSLYQAVAVPPSLDSLFIFYCVRADFQHFIPNLAPKVHSGADLPQAVLYAFAMLALVSSAV